MSCSNSDLNALTSFIVPFTSTVAPSSFPLKLLVSVLVLFPNSIFPVHVPEVVKVFSCSTHLSIKYKLPINIKIPRMEFLAFISLKPIIYPAYKC